MTVIVWEWFRNKRLLRLFIKHFASEFSLICLKFGPPSHKILKPQAFGKFGLDGIALGQESKIWLLIPPITYSLCDTGQVTTSLSPRFLHSKLSKGMWILGLSQVCGERPAKGRGWGFQDGEHMYTHGWFMWMYGKNHPSIVISLQSK